MIESRRRGRPPRSSTSGPGPSAAAHVGRSWAGRSCARATGRHPLAVCLQRPARRVRNLTIDMLGTDGELRSLTIARLSDSRYAAAIANARAQVSDRLATLTAEIDQIEAIGGSAVGEGRPTGDDPGRLRQVLRVPARRPRTDAGRAGAVGPAGRSTAHRGPVQRGRGPPLGRRGERRRSGGRCWSMRSEPTRCGCCRRSLGLGRTCSTRTGSCSCRPLLGYPRADGVSASCPLSM